MYNNVVWWNLGNVTVTRDATVLGLAEGVGPVDTWAVGQRLVAAGHRGDTTESSPLSDSALQN